MRAFQSTLLVAHPINASKATNHSVPGRFFMRTNLRYPAAERKAVAQSISHRVITPSIAIIL